MLLKQCRLPLCHQTVPHSNGVPISAQSSIIITLKITIKKRTLKTYNFSTMGILPTKTPVHLLYRHAACHCGMPSTVHHLKKVQFLWNPCCAVNTKQLYYSYLYMPPL